MSETGRRSPAEKILRGVGTATVIIIPAWSFYLAILLITEDAQGLRASVTGGTHSPYLVFPIVFGTIIPVIASFIATISTWDKS